MKNFKILLLSIASSLGAMAADLDVTPGKLEGLLADGGKGQTELKIAGTMDARDLAVFENLAPDVKTLDLSGITKIEALSMPTRKYFGRTLFKEGELPAYTFFKAGVTAISLPQELNIIGEGTFAGSEIESITIPEGVTEIGDYAFYGCPNLKEVKLPSTLTRVGKGAFGNCTALETIDLSDTRVNEIPEKAFAGAVSLSKLILPANMAVVGREAFSHTKIEELDLSRISRFEAYALSSMPFLTTLAINPEAEISDGLLMDDISLASLTGLPEFIPDYFAANCSKFDATMMNDASILGKYSFANTLAPEELVLSSFITKIGRGALSGLTSIAKIDATALEDKVPEVEEFSFEGINPGAIELWVDHNAYELWEADPYWSAFNIKHADETGVEEVGADVSSGISIYAVGGLLVVESPATIAEIRVYTTDGRMAYVASPNQERVEIETASLPSGVVITAATDGEGNTSTVSILLK